MIYEQILAEHTRLTTQITQIKNELEQMPEGHLFCTRNATRYKWYHSNGHKQTYIPKHKHSPNGQPLLLPPTPNTPIN